MAFTLDPVLGLRLVKVFGFLNVFFFLMIAGTCRCVLGVKFFNELMKQKWYSWLFNHHCWYWRLLMLSVALHIALVVMVFGISF